MEDNGGGGDLYGAAIGMSPFGVHYGSADDLHKIFVKPFVDVFKVAAGKTKEVARRSITAVQVAFEAIATSLIPFVQDSYSEIFKEQKKDLDKIKLEYKDVYDSTFEAFKHSDIAITAMFCYPQYVFTGLLAQRSPAEALKLMGVISGGALEPVIHKIQNKFGTIATHSPSPSKKPSKDTFASDAAKIQMPSFGENILREKSEKNNRKKELTRVVTNKRLINAALQTSKAQELQKRSREFLNETLSKIVEQAKAIVSLNSVEEIQKAIGKPVSGIEQIKSLPKEELNAANKKLLKTLKTSVKTYYVKELEAQVEELKKYGFDESTEIVAKYKEAISTIKGLLFWCMCSKIL